MVSKIPLVIRNNNIVRQHDKKFSNQTHLSKTDSDSSLARKPNTPKGSNIRYIYQLTVKPE